MHPVRNEWWDGKIGTWFFTEQVAARRNSVNRPAGTIETKPVKVSKEVFVGKCISALLPAIENKWPGWCPKRVRIQQDNAPAHPKPGKSLLLNEKIAEMQTRGWYIEFVAQPPNSPDCNVEDLCFFRAIQAIQYTKPSKNIDELIAHVQEAYEELSLHTCKKVWTSLQMVMNEIILCGGNNNYKLTHASKEKLMFNFGRDIPLHLPCEAYLSRGPINGQTIRTEMIQQFQDLHRGTGTWNRSSNSFVYCCVTGSILLCDLICIIALIRNIVLLSNFWFIVVS
jgi:hypothetical protein